MATAKSEQPAPSSKETPKKKTLETRTLTRKASLTEGESAFLHALLIDSPSRAPRNQEDGESEQLKKMDDEALFSLPFENYTRDAGDRPKVPPKPRRRQGNWIGLWKAFEAGVHPVSLRKRAPPKRRDTPPREIIQETKAADESDDESCVNSDATLRAEKTEVDEMSNGSSWDDEEGGYEHYDAWEVMKDEYAGDFGFDYSLRNTLDDLDDEGNQFAILGTSADDKSAQPHVLSPPLMDSLVNFLPEAHTKENWWLKYSLVRDGADLNIFKQYVRGAKNLILAIETTKGDVFGAYTGSYWRTQYGYYGSGEAFLWKMRYNRTTPCKSLFEQAQLETDIDVYYYAHLNRFVQLLTHDKLAIGGGDLPEDVTSVKGAALDDSSTVMTPTNKILELDEETGFGIALTDDLLRGTSSPCATFRSPCLVGQPSRGEAFDVVNLEAWTFTPCFDVDSAQKLELTKFFVHESTRTLSSTGSTDLASLLEEVPENHPSSPGARSGSSPIFNSRDLVQRQFYRRVGENDRSEQERDRWQYASMMH